jgi:CheY-like chemotaxis protein
MPKSLLVVDDSTTIRQAVQNALSGEDWTVTSAETLDDGLDILQGQSPDAVLCDAALGEGDGYGACRAIREVPSGATVPLILMGANVSDGIAMAAGANAILTKPFDSAELVRTLASSFEQRATGFDLEGLEPVEEDPLELEPTSFLDESEAVEELSEIEVLDMSSEEDFEHLDVLQDLEPISASLATAGEGALQPEEDAEPANVPPSLFAGEEVEPETVSPEGGDEAPAGAFEWAAQEEEAAPPEAPMPGAEMEEVLEGLESAEAIGEAAPTQPATPADFGGEEPLEDELSRPTGEPDEAVAFGAQLSDDSREPAAFEEPVEAPPSAAEVGVETPPIQDEEIAATERWAEPALGEEPEQKAAVRVEWGAEDRREESFAGEEAPASPEPAQAMEAALTAEEPSPEEEPAADWAVEDRGEALFADEEAPASPCSAAVMEEPGTADEVPLEEKCAADWEFDRQMAPEP